MTRLHVVRRIVDRIGAGLDDRFTFAGLVRKQSSHVFPKHHSFFWGELALYSFVVLLLSGTVLALRFVPDTTDTVYTGEIRNITMGSTRPGQNGAGTV
jgi:quinol---cytochrome-c reductase cytochrome b subunit